MTNFTEQSKTLVQFINKMEECEHTGNDFIIKKEDIQLYLKEFYKIYNRFYLEEKRMKRIIDEMLNMTQIELEAQPPTCPAD